MKTLLCTFLSILFCINGYSQPVALDLSFGTFGIVTTDFGSEDEISSCAVMADGRIVAGGTSDGNPIDNLALARYLPDGIIDHSFGNNGTIEIAAGLANESLSVIEIALNSQNQILVLGHPNNTSNDPWFVYCFNEDGTLDNSFANNGKFEYSSGFSDRLRDLAIGPDDKIVVAAEIYNDPFYQMLVCLNPDGSFDNTFSTDGIAQYDQDNFWDGPTTELLIQPDGKMVMGGVSGPGGFAVSRFNSDGTVDSAFGINGLKIVTILSDEEYLEGLFLQSDGKIIGGGTAGDDILFPDPHYGAFRLNTDGSMDTSFADTGQRWYKEGWVGACLLTECENLMLIASPSILLNEDGSKNKNFGDFYLPSTIEDVNAFKLHKPGTFLQAGSKQSNFAIARLKFVCDSINTDYTYQVSGLEVTMLNQATRATAWHWDFGDGTSSSDQNPVHTFASPGIYHVCLEECGPCGTGSICKDISICPIPTGLSVSNITSTTATLSWNAVEGVIKYKIRYKVTGNNPWITVYSSSATKILKGLSPNTPYTCQVKSICSVIPAVESPWSAKKNFSTSLKLGEEEIHVPVAIGIYPNPLSSSTTVSFSLEENSHITIDLFDLAGRKIKMLLDEDLDEGNHEVQLNREELASGSYLLQLRSAGTIVTRKIVIE